MNSQTLIADLNETQILSAIREQFAGEHVEGINVQKLMEHCRTLDELFASIRNEMNLRDTPRNHRNNK